MALHLKLLIGLLLLVFAVDSFASKAPYSTTPVPWPWSVQCSISPAHLEGNWYFELDGKVHRLVIVFGSPAQDQAQAQIVELSDYQAEKFIRGGGAYFDDDYHIYVRMYSRTGEADAIESATIDAVPIDDSNQCDSNRVYYILTFYTKDRVSILPLRRE